MLEGGVSEYGRAGVRNVRDIAKPYQALPGTPLSLTPALHFPALHSPTLHTPNSKFRIFLALTHQPVFMKIRVVSLLEGAQGATGTAVIVDVFRAFTTAAVALERGIQKIIFVAQPDEALNLREAGLADLCVGEVGGIPPPGFDFGNSPHELSQADISGKIIAHSTRAGTVGVTAAGHCERIYGASLINARATVQAILNEALEEVTIVAMGLAGALRTDEDEQCALYLRNLLEGRNPNPDAVKQLVRSSGEVGKFMDPAQPYLYPEDIDFALRINEIDRPVRIEREDDMLVARP